MQSFHSDNTDRLYKAISLMKTPEEVAALLEDLCTINEIVDMAQRLSAAKKLTEGANYKDIAKDVGISTATISRVSRCINYGTGGYSIALDRLKNTENEEE